MSVYELQPSQSGKTLAHYVTKTEVKYLKNNNLQKNMNYIVNNEKLIIQYISKMVLELINLLYQIKG
jgi:hypothetical protein